MAQSISLAVLENLVHMNREDFPAGFVVVAAQIPSEILTPWEGGQLPADTRTWGDLWLQQQASAVLEVPSMVVPGECNFLVNPLHPDFAKIVVESPVPFEFDSRLFRQ